MKNPITLLRVAAALAVFAQAAWLPNALGQIETAGDLLVDVDATLLAAGPITTVANVGAAGGVFEATGGGANAPKVVAVGGDGTLGIRFDGNDFMEHLAVSGGAVMAAPAGLVGLDPTRSVEAWVFNVTIPNEETIVGWGRRGGPDGSNMSFLYGTNNLFGAAGHWGGSDIGWDDAGGAPSAGQWHHLVYTYDGTTTRVYVDGVLANSEVVGAGVINTHPNGIVLASQRDSSGNVNGGARGSLILGKIRIHDGVLSDTQIADNYAFEANEFFPGLGIDPTPGPIHRYTFNEAFTNDATGLIVTDIAGDEDGLVQNGTGSATFTGTRVALSGGSSATAPYVDLPNGLLSTNSADNGGSGEVTIEGWVTLTAPRSWARIFDFGSTTVGEITGPGGSGNGYDYLFLSAQIDGDTAFKRAEVINDDPVGGGIAGATTYDFGSFTLGLDTHFAVTWNESTGEIVVYENGIEVGSFMTDKRISNINDVNVWLGRSNWLADNNMQGEFNEFRIYNHVLTPQEVLGSYEAGPNAGLAGPGPLQNVDMQVEKSEMTLDTFQQLIVIGDYLNVSNILVTTAEGISYESDDTNVLTVSASGEVKAVGIGTATITVNLETRSDSAPITVVPLVTTLEHRYSFDADASDSVGSADGTLGGSATLAGGQVVMAAATMDYVQLPAGIVSGFEAVTVEAWASFGANGNWNRLFDFGNTNNDALGRNYLMMSPRSGAGDIRTGISDGDPGYTSEQNATTPGNLDNQNNVHIVAVYFPQAHFQALYLNGCFAAANSNTTIQLTGVDDALNYIGRSLYAGDSWLNGSVDEFRIYNGVLTPEQIALNAATGPGTTVEDPGALMSAHLQAEEAMLVESTQTALLLGDFENLSDVNLCGFGTPGFASSDENIFTVDAEGLITAIGAGTATLTGTFNTFEDTLSITVTNPPKPKITLLHRYSFNEATGSTVEPDLVGGADGTVLGTALYNGTGQLTLDGADGTFVNLPNGIISVLSNATFEAWVTHNSTRVWERIFDFGISVQGEDLSGTGDKYLFLTPRSGDGGTANAFRFAVRPSNAGAEDPVLNGAGPLVPGQEVHIVVTYDETLGISRLYTNGVRVASGTVTIPLSTIDDRNNWLGRAQWGDPYFTGIFNEFRISSGAMDGDQVAASFAAGPNAEIGGVRLTIVNNGDGTITLSWPLSASDYFLEFTNDEPVSGAFWDLVFDIPDEVGDNYQLTLPANQAAEYYRLSK